MNRLLLAAALALPLAAIQQSTASSQTAPAARAARAPNPGGLQPGGATAFMSILEYPSNQESGVDTDRFIGTPGKAFAKVWNGLMTRSMLRAGDPYSPGPEGSVLEYRDDLAVATVDAHAETGTAAAPGIVFYYVQGGEGHIDTGPSTKSYDLHPGVGVLLAPNVKQHLVSTGDKPLSMIMLTWTKNDGMKVKQDIKVVDTNTEPLGANRAHWVMTAKSMFGNEDGVNITMGAVYIPAGTYTGPHAHGHGAEEIWVKTGFDLGYAILGSEIREIDGPGAFLAPPNGLTTHSSMNLNKDHSAIWLYLSRRVPTANGGSSPLGPSAP